MDLFNKFESNNTQQTEQKENKTKIMSLKIILKKEPDYIGGLNFEGLTNNFNSHIKIGPDKANEIYEKFISHEYCYIHRPKDEELDAWDKYYKWAFSTLYILNMCNKWGKYCHLWEHNYGKGWVADINDDDYLITRIFFKPLSSSPLKPLEGFMLGSYFLTQSLIADILDDVISKEAKVYFENNLKITSLTYADEKLVKKIFEDNITVENHIGFIVSYERNEEKNERGKQQ